MTRQEKNEQFLLSSFLYGGNASYIEDLYARFKADPKSIDPTWAGYFGKLEDTGADVAKNAEGPSWQRADWPQQANGELVAALDAGEGHDLAALAASLGFADHAHLTRVFTATIGVPPSEYRRAGSS